ncbi:uncharacterized protein LOC129971765 [Argiope bruennichi]|uniref:uncharacterized protein LOC129971765 n=1 Tax=Argiope bruennichi TaxID=94029 RepID=UPI00249579FD|nr:uncharacterized protein LOC129971765 [Argiope bruennichi]
MSFSTMKIKWNFNPPTAARWERMIRMLKEMLRRIWGQKSIDYEELETLICDCEATINSRPLTYIENNSEGLRALTRACFLQGIPNSDKTDLDEIDMHKGCHNREVSLNVGDAILLETDGKRFHWPLGIVYEVLPKADGHSRIARQKDKNTNTQLPAIPVVSDQDSTEDDDYITKVAPDVVTKAGRRIKIPNRLNL